MPAFCPRSNLTHSTPKVKATDQYIEFYQAQRRQIEAHSLPALNARREAAAAALAKLGFPTQKQERYKYTDVAASFAPNYGILTRPRTQPEALVGHLSLERYGTLADVNADAITAVNTMLAQELTTIHVEAGQQREHPIRITNTWRATAPLMQNRRLLIVANAGAHVQIIFQDHAQSEQDFLTTQVTEIFVGEGAHVEFYDIEDTHARCHRFHQVFVQVAANGHFTHGAFTLAGGVSRNQTDVRLIGEGADVHLLGCAILSGSQHTDNNTLIDHAAASCTSRELYKYVVDQQATGAFAGRVLVREDAQHTDSVERNANLVCTDQARMWTQPMLEIYADDVKCAHGSTVGQLNDDALFYMQQRGISHAEARMLLKQAFASEVIRELPLEALQPRLTAMVEKRFRSCEDCQLCNK